MDERVIAAFVVAAVLILMFFVVRRRGRPATQEPTEEPAKAARVQNEPPKPAAPAADTARPAAPTLGSSTNFTELVKRILSRPTADLGAEWRMEPATDRQLAYLRDFSKEGDIPVPRQVTKGQASDCIGLFKDPTDEEVEMLTFFKLREPALPTQTHYRWALAPLLADPQRVEEWEARPANTRLKDEIRFLGGTVPQGTTQRDAVSLRDKLAEENPEQAAKLEDLSRGYEEAVDLETRVEERTSRFTWAQYRKAVNSLLEDEEWEDVVDVLGDGLVHDYLKELYPRLEIK